MSKPTTMSAFLADVQQLAFWVANDADQKSAIVISKARDLLAQCEQLKTAGGITRTGPAHVSGRHRSDAANEPASLTEDDFIKIDLAALREKTSEAQALREEHRAIELQVQRQGSAV